MTWLIGSIFVDEAPRANASAAVAAERGADMVEYRIDHLAGQPESVATLIHDSPLPCIITARHAREGGDFTGTTAELLELWQAAIDAGARFIDTELSTWQSDANARAGLRHLLSAPREDATSTRLILSSHDFQQRPTDLLQRVEAMANEPYCSVIKLAWMARSLRDNLEAFALLEHRPKLMIALCMGEAGQMSRILAKKYDAAGSFASLSQEAGTAPGQVAIEKLKNLYRWDAQHQATQLFGVIGWPVEHSLSPNLHNTGFDAAQYDGVYVPMPIPDAYEAFKATVGALLDLPSLRFRGASVTLPHKENLLRFVDEHDGEVEELSRRIGAANTLAIRDDGSLYACNTDYAAALDVICEAKRIQRADLAEMRVAILGAGGVARALVAGLAHYGATVVIYNRTVDRAEQLAAQFHGLLTAAGDKAKVVAMPLDRICDSCCQVIVNCTSVGLWPNVDQSPIEKWSEILSSDTLVFDTIYRPTQTRLLREATERGLTAVNGVGMFIGQAQRQFELWTGTTVPDGIFEQVMAGHLEEDEPRQAE